MKKNNGFTLVELIAVITILSLIVLVSVPVIINTINRAEQKEYDKFKQIVVNAAELYLERNRDLYPHFSEIGDSIDINAETLIKEGYLKSDLIDPIDNNKVSKYKVSVIYGQDGILEYKTLKRKTFAELATTTDEVTSVNACALSGTCQVGTKFAIQVNENDIYNFYVISDDGNEVSLIMDRNLGDNVPWISAEDYATANSEEGDQTYCAYDACSDEGPLTAVNTLKIRTDSWTNINVRQYTYGDDGGGNRYSSFTETMRARLLTYEEAISEIIGCGQTAKSCPEWLYKNLRNTGDVSTYGYWTTAAHPSNSHIAWNIYGVGRVDCHDISNNDINHKDSHGLRPVITVSRSL